MNELKGVKTEKKVKRLTPQSREKNKKIYMLPFTLLLYCSFNICAIQVI